MVRFHSSRFLVRFLFLSVSAAWVSPSSAASLEMEVEYQGCQAVLLPGPVCVPDSKRPLHLWVGAPPAAEIEIRAGGKRLDDGGELFREGRRFTVSPPAGAEKLDVIVKAADRKGTWSLALGDRRGAARDVLGEVREKATHLHGDITARHLDAARRMLDGIQLPAHAPAESRCLVAYSRCLLAEREGDFRTALAEIQKVVETAERVHLVWYQWGAEEELALLLPGVGRYREAAEIFERLRQKPQSTNPCNIAGLLSNQAWSALLAREAGEAFADPTALVERALATFETCKGFSTGNRVDLLINLALAHLQEGRLAAARDALTRAHELEPHPPLSHTLWWLDLEARMARQEGRPMAALALYDQLGELAVAAGSPDGRLRAALGRARSQDDLGNSAAALETLRGAEALLDGQSLQIPVDQGRETFMAKRQAIVGLHLQILLNQGRNAEALAVARHARSRVLRQLEHVDRLAGLTQDQRSQWSRLLQTYQARRAALEERVKDDWALPLDQRPQIRAARKAEAEAVKGLLDEAFLVLGGAGERPEEAPLAPRPGELILAYHPLPGGWVGFAADGATVAAHRFELPPDLRLLSGEELSRRLLLPFRGAIERAKRIRILASGLLEGVDFHALPFDSDVLLTSHPVVYGLDLPVAASPARRPGRHALLVADPRGDLPGARDETRAVRRVLESGPRPWIAEELKDAEAATLQDRLAAADLLHYAGHGTFSGFGGWESGLLLANENRLTLGDVLALDRVPAWVVLSACDSGRSSDETPVAGLGLAQAFLLAGSRSVVASTRPADDRKVPGFIAELYRQWDREPDLAVALQRTQLSWRTRNPAWAAFRLFEP